MKIRNTTLHNRSKRDRLIKERHIPRHHIASREVASYLLTLDDIDAPVSSILYSIGSQLLNGRTDGEIVSFLSEYDIPLVDVGSVPSCAFDILGSAYQYLSTKAENLSKGAFYTGPAIARDLLGGLSFEAGEEILDPSCGSGVLLFLSDAPPDRLVGIDSDPIAVMIAKFNYFLKFVDAPSPQIYCGNFFNWFATNSHRRFSYVVGNPPYGGEVDSSIVASSLITSGESFSHFTECGYRLLADGGELRYLLPAAALNVPRHADLRDFLLDFADLRRIKRYNQKFSGVMTDVYLVEVGKTSMASAEDVVFEQDGERTHVAKSFLGSLGRILSPWSSNDMEILAKVRSLGKYTLANSIFGLGVVTGDNKTKLFSEPKAGTEPIYTGKEVERYRLSLPNKHLVFDRSSLQQVAPDDLYRAPEKLVYKVIGVDLRFALDTTGSLTTNSANIVIPNIPGYDAACVMALLNSDLYSFLHRKLFGGVNKIAKANLKRLMFPELSEEQRRVLSKLTKDVISGKSDEVLQGFIHEQIFRLSHEEVTYIRRSIKTSDIENPEDESGSLSSGQVETERPDKSSVSDCNGKEAHVGICNVGAEVEEVQKLKRRGRPPKVKLQDKNARAGASVGALTAMSNVQAPQMVKASRQISLFDEE